MNHTCTFFMTAAITAYVALLTRAFSENENGKDKKAHEGKKKSLGAFIRNNLFELLFVSCLIGLCICMMLQESVA